MDFTSVWLGRLPFGLSKPQMVAALAEVGLFPWDCYLAPRGTFSDPKDGSAVLKFRSTEEAGYSNST